MFGIFGIIAEFNTIESCCPRKSRRPQKPPAPPPPPVPIKPEPKGPQLDQPEALQPEEEIPEAEQPEAPAPGRIRPIAPGDRSSRTRPKARVRVRSRPRPSLGLGLQPLIQSLNEGAVSLLGVVEPWEIWWSRNRDSYLNFKNPVKWVKIVAEGSTKSVTTLPVYENLINTLREALADKNHYLAFRAAIALGKVRDANNQEIASSMALDILKKAHKSETRYFVRNNILLALGITGDASVSSTIISVLKSKDPPLRRSYAALAAGYIENEPEIIKELKKIAHNPREDKEVRSCACIALGNLKDESAVPFLSAILNAFGSGAKAPSQLKAFAALGLGRIGTPKALAALRKCTPATQRDIEIKAAVAVALGLTKTPKAKNHLLLFLNDRNPTVRGLAALSLGQIKAKDSFKLIFNAYKKNRSNDAQGLMILAMAFTDNEKAKTELRKILTSKKSRVLLKASAMIALGILKDNEAVPTIIEILSRKRQLNDVILTPYLIMTLGMIEDTRGIEVLQNIWNKIDTKKLHLLAYHTNLGVALTLLGKRDAIVIPTLQKQIKQTDDSLLRTYALHTLSLIGTAETADSFIDAYNDKNTYVKFSTINGIGFLMDNNKVSQLNKITADCIDVQMQIMNHLLPIPVW